MQSLLGWVVPSSIKEAYEQWLPPVRNILYISQNLECRLFHYSLDGVEGKECENLWGKFMLTNSTQRSNPPPIDLVD